MRTCYNCGSDKTYIRKEGWSQWHKHDENWYCKKCHMKLFYNPKHHKITNPIWNRRKIVFKGKQITLKENPRTGVCNLCRKQCKTAMHHIEYHDEDVLKDTIELCISCHKKQHPDQKRGPLGYYI